MEQQFIFSSIAWEHNNKRLIKQIFKILPLYDEGEDWKSQQLKVIAELHGYNEIFIDNPAFMTMIAMLSALDHITDKMIFRKFVFDSITELKNVQISE